MVTKRPIKVRNYKIGIIPNNAWKRQLEQVGRKYAIAQKFGGAFALVMGETLYEYVKQLFPAKCPYTPNWEIALVSLAESPNNRPGPVSIDTVADALFMTFADFISAVIGDYPIPESLPDPFDGTYTTFSNREYIVQEGQRIA